MIEKLLQFFKAIKNNWGKFILFLVFVLVFVFVLFPLDDLGDLVSSQVAKLTNNSIYVRFDKMGISILPQPGMQLKQVYIETTNLAPLSAQELTLSPSIPGLLSQKPFGHFSAHGFMKGSVEVKVGSGKRSDNNVERYQLDVTLANLSLIEIRRLINLPVLLRGQISMDLTNGQIDPSFTEQPEGDIILKVDKFELPASNLQTPMGGLTLPELRLGQILIKGRLSGGRINIIDGIIGREGDEIFGHVKGNLGMTIMNNGGILTPQLGAYSFDIDLKVKRSFQDKAALFLSFIDTYKTQLPDGGQYRIKISGANFMMPPSMGALR